MRSNLTRIAVGLLFLACAGGVRGAEITPDPWPREFTTPKGNTAVMYQPQIETFKGDTLTGRAAVSVTKKDDKTTKFGVIFFSAGVSVDRDDRSVEILRLKVNRVRFPDITPEKEKTFAGIVEAEVPKWNLVISYDRALEAVKVADREKRSAQGLKNDPPKVIFAQEPTVLVLLDGEPQLRDVETAPGLKVVVNTALFMVLDTRNNRYYLAGGKKWWYEASDAKGPWRPIGGPPADIADLAVQAAQAQKKNDEEVPEEDGTESSNPPRIVVATEPTELVVSEGKPSFKPVAGVSADLLSMENTESDVLMDVPTQNYYVLLSGRWFRSKSLSGGSYAYVAPDQLPASFKRIPADSDIGDMRASVPGTDEAEDAVLDAQIPQTTAVKRADAHLDVQYDGEPKFVPIEGTKTEYAVNTPTSVLRIGGRYYACANAIWYVSDSPMGPWALAEAVPSDDIDQIPPSVPVYNVKYVRVYDSTPDEIYYGYTPGYEGCYPWGGTVVWGTGWNYRPWAGPLFWWPRPYTWGFHAHYTPWSGWGFGSSWSYPFFSTSFGWGGWFRPVGWGRPGRIGGGWGGRRGWFGPGGYRPPTVIVNRYWGSRPGGIRPPGWNRAAARLGAGVNRPGAGRPGRPVIGFHPPAKDIRPARIQNNIYSRGRDRGRDVPRSPSRITSRPADRGNNIYAGQNGQVYRKTKEGWQQRDKDAWRSSGGGAKSVVPNGRPITRQATPRQELNRDFQARQRGEARAQSWSRPAPSQPKATSVPRSSQPRQSQPRQSSSSGGNSKPKRH